MITVSYIPLGTNQTIRSRFPDDEWEEAWELYEEQKPDCHYAVVHFGLNAVNEEIMIAENFHPENGT